MNQPYRVYKKLRGRTVQMFLCLSIAGIITTIWFAHREHQKYKSIGSRNVEDSVKANLKDTLTTGAEDTLFQYTSYCDFFGNTNTVSIAAKKGTLSPTLYVITPTYQRPEQIPELTRLGQTLRQVENIHWIVAEDAKILTPAVRKTVKKMGIPYTILVAPMPVEHLSEPGLKPKGVSNRMAALQWLRNNNITKGVIYFADDDNTYDLELFEEIRQVKKIGMWPVGLVSHFGVNSPIVKNGKVVGFYIGWKGRRVFPVDMASFGVSLSYLSKFPNITMPYWHGYEETVFLAALNITIDDIEPLAANCTKILVWHTQTIKKDFAEKTEGLKYNDTNIPFLLDQIP